MAPLNTALSVRFTTVGEPVSLKRLIHRQIVLTEGPKYMLISDKGIGYVVYIMIALRLSWSLHIMDQVDLGFAIKLKWEENNSDSRCQRNFVKFES